MLNTIEMDYTNIDASVVGQDNGLELLKVYALFNNQVGNWISEIHAGRKEPENWTVWLDAGEQIQLAQAIKTYAESVKGQFENVLVLGIGGSALGGLAVTEALLKPYWNLLTPEQRNGYPRIFFMDNIDPDQFDGLLSTIDLSKTLVNVISKSGTTAETMSQYLIIHQKLRELCGDNYKNNLVFTTDEKKGVLRKIAQDENILTFPVPDGVGGRFSVFTAVGLLPFALVGLDIEQMLEGIRKISPTTRSGSIYSNIAAQAGIIHALLDQKKGKKISVFMPYSSRLRYVSDWYCQLWAESLGKESDLKGNKVNSGQTPVKAIGATDQHSQIQLYNEGPNDKVITFIRVKKFDKELKMPATYSNIPELEYLSNKTMNSLIDAEANATQITISGFNKPNLTYKIPEVNEFYLAQLMYTLMVQTAIAAKVYGINAYDQPGVEQGKNYTYALLGRKGYEKTAMALKVRIEKPPIRLRGL